MSTPVSIDTPPRPTMKKPEEEDHLLQARLQEMLDLQYEQQEREQEEMNMTEGQPHHQSYLLAPSSDAAMLANSNSSQRNEMMGMNNASERRMEDAAALAGVGQGTLLFPKGYPDSNPRTTTTTATTDSSASNINQSMRRTDVSLFAMHQQMIRDTANAANAAAHQMQSLTDGNRNRPLHYGSMPPQQHQQEELPYQQFTERAPAAPQGNFHPHYDSSSGPQIVFHLPPDDASPYASRYQRAYHPSHYATNNNTSCCQRIESCWSKFQQSQQQQQPTCHRSFCYGAIDGLLTGSGIVAALVGMQILLPEQPPSLPTFWTTRWSIVVLCWAACGSDAICMALSHLWNGHMTLQSQGHARRQMQRFFVLDRNRAKAQLMDWLVQQQGLLKIDAMSLADTLEGYPDLFASVLMGDPLVSPIFQPASSQASNLNQRQLPPPPHSYQQQEQDQQQHGYNEDPRFGPTGPYSQHHHHHHHHQEDEDDQHHQYRPYGIDSDRDEEIYGDCTNHGCCCCCTEEDEGEHGVGTGDHQSHSSNPSYLLWQESQWESWCMLWGFWMASGIPSLLFLVVPYLLLPTTPISSTTTASTGATTLSTETSSDTSTPGGATSVASVVVTLTALIMWCLGVWKSHFHPSNGMMGGGNNVLGSSSSHSLFPDKSSSAPTSSSSSLNWMIFGMETVVILLVCMASAFTFGWFLSQVFVYSNLHHHHNINHNMTLQFHQ